MKPITDKLSTLLSQVQSALKQLALDEERAALPADVDVFHVEQLQVPRLDAERCIVWMRLRA